MDEGLLVPTPCSVFKEPLLYFFYGRPAYRPIGVVEPTSLNACSLVSFVVDSNSVGRPKRIFPFDSGGLQGGIYSKFVHPGMKLTNFELVGTLDNIRKLVTLFFGTNSNYYRGKCLPEVNFSAMEFEAQCYYELIRTLAQTKPDDRRGTVEVQFDAAVDFSACKVDAVIVPEDFLDDQAVVEFICGTLGAMPLKYVCYHARPVEDVGAILEVARQFLADGGVL